jgi:hypothetical protein
MESSVCTVAKMTAASDPWTRGVQERKARGAGLGWREERAQPILGRPCLVGVVEAEIKGWRDAIEVHGDDL